jgi:hypothetical protein
LGFQINPTEDKELVFSYKVSPDWGFGITKLYIALIIVLIEGDCCKERVSGQPN